MDKKTFTIRFDMDDEIDRRVYYAIKNLPEFLEETNASKALINFINDMVIAVGECEERKKKCAAVLSSLLGEKPDGKVVWQ